MNLKIRLILLFLLVGIVPMLVVGVLSYSSARENIEAEAYKAKAMFSGLADQRLTDYFNDLENDSRIIANTQEAYQSLNILATAGGDKASPEWKAQELVLDNYLPILARDSHFAGIFLTDAFGVCVYDSAGTLEGTDLSIREYIQASLAGQTAWSEFFFFEFINQNALVVSHPVRTAGLWGNLIGTVNILLTDPRRQRCALFSLKSGLFK